MTLMFDGHEFGELVVYGDPVITMLPSTAAYVDTPSKQGLSVADVRYAGWTVAFTIVVDGTAHERRDKLSTLGMWLDVDGPRRLVLPDTPDRYYMAVPEGQLELTRGIRSEYGQLSFTVVEPAAYGDEHSITVPSGGSVTFNVDGTYKAAPIITANATRNSSSLVWGLRLDEGDYLHIATDSASARPIVADCGERTLSVNGSVAIPTLDSDWLELEPGVHTLRMDNGTGAATVTWRDRWL